MKQTYALLLGLRSLILRLPYRRYVCNLRPSNSFQNIIYCSRPTSLAPLYQHVIWIQHDLRS